MRFSRIHVLKRYAQMCHERGSRLTENPISPFTHPCNIYPAAWWGREAAANAMITYELHKLVRTIRENL